MIFRRLKKQDAPRLKVLFSQLTERKVRVEVAAMMRDSNLYAIVAEEDGKVIGFGALTMFRTPTNGRVGRIEDIVIDEDHRGGGRGKALVEELIRYAKRQGLKKIALTSKPSRGTEKFYLDLDFEKVLTDVYVRDLKKEEK